MLEQLRSPFVQFVSYAALCGVVGVAACSDDTEPLTTTGTTGGTGGSGGAGGMGGAGGIGGAGGMGGATPCVENAVGECVGVPVDPICDDDYCVMGVSCSATVQVTNNSELDAAVATATTGSCIALAPGDYHAVTLTQGGNLLGKGAAFVSVDAVQLQGGESLFRGIAVGAGGVAVNDATAMLESLLVADATGVGVDISSGGSATLLTTTVSGAGTYGVKAVAHAGLAITDSALISNGGPGVWAACDEEAPPNCSCAQNTIALTNVVASDNALVGAALGNAAVNIDRLAIDNTHDYQDQEAPASICSAPRQTSRAFRCRWTTR